MIKLVHQYKETEYDYVSMYYSFYYGREYTHAFVVKGNDLRSIKEVHDIVVYNIVGNFSSFVGYYYKDIDSIPMMEDKESLKSLYHLLEDLVERKKTIGWKELCKLIWDKKKIMYSCLSMLEKDKDKRMMEYVSLMGFIKETVVSEGKNVFGILHEIK